MPVEPEVKDKVACESGPRTTPAGVCEYCWNGARMSSPSPEREPVTPDSVRAMAGTWKRRERLDEMNSDTLGARTPALEMTSKARGVETER